MPGATRFHEDDGGILSVQRSILTNPHVFSTAIPVLAAAPEVSAKTFEGQTALLDVSSHAANQYKIVSMPKHLDTWRSIYKTRDHDAAIKAMDEIVAAVLPLVKVDGRHTPLTLDAVSVYQMALSRGAYFPDLHWDYDWSMFPDTAGFNLWYLIDEPPPHLHGRGNMFMATTPELLPTDPPQRWDLSSPQGVVKRLHIGLSDGPIFPLNAYSSIEQAKLNFQYLAMRSGECLIFSKRTLHMSDPRPHLPEYDGVSVENNTRLAMNVRLVPFTDAELPHTHRMCIYLIITMHSP